MDMNSRCFHILALAAIAVSLLLPAAACQTAGPDAGNVIQQAYNGVREWFIMQGAGDRIEKIRKGDGTVLVLDENNVPVRGARVYYEQQKQDFLFGTNLALLAKNGPTSVNQEWADACSALFNYGTVPFYWESYEAAQGQTSATMLKMIAEWAKKRGITIKGDPLIWANSLPSWAPIAADDMQKAQEKRVKETVAEFCGTIDYWDVVNEPTMGARVNNPLGNWMAARTPVTVSTDALAWARSACPTSTLIINDFRTDQDFRDLLQGITRQKGKFDAVGIQSHMHRGNWPLYQVWDTCERFKDFGVRMAHHAGRGD
jgi:endo-1,4-beta-xylanase